MVIGAAIVGGIIGFLVGLVLPRGQAGYDRVVVNAITGAVIGAVVTAVFAAMYPGALK